MYLAIGAGSIPVSFLINDDDSRPTIYSTAVASGTAVVDLVVEVHACQQPHIYIVAARRGRGAVDYSSRSTAVVG